MGQQTEKNPFQLHPLYQGFASTTCPVKLVLGFSDSLSSKESACNAEDAGDAGLIPGWKDPPGEGNGKWQITPVFLPGESRVQGCLVVALWAVVHGISESDLT